MSDARTSAALRRVAGSEVVTLRAGDLRAEVLSFGAHLVGMQVPDRAGTVDDVVVSLRDADGEVDVAGYRDPGRNPHLGGMVGRFANRIAGARFELDGVLHVVTPNEGPNQLHGGPVGFDRREWTMSTDVDDRGAAARLHLRSGDGDQGFPGAVEVAVTYRVDLDGELRIEVEGSSDAPTPLNVTNHSYWNLSGTSAPSSRAGASVRGHQLRVDAERVVRVDAAVLPTGDLDRVDGTVFDLRAPVVLGEALGAPALAAVGGFDHCFVLQGDAGSPRAAASVELVDPGSGRRLRLFTDQPGVQVYTANHGAGPLPRHGAVCLETQHLPDAPNQATFPSAVLSPGATYRHRDVVRFDTVG